MQKVFYMPIPSNRIQTNNRFGSCCGIFFSILLISLGIYLISSYDLTSIHSVLKDQIIKLQEKGEIEEAFTDFIETYGKEYVSIKEKQKRYKIFTDNYQRAQEHNSQGKSYTLGVTKFMDLTHEEFSEYVGHLKPRTKRNVVDFKNYPAPDPNIDWQAKGKVTRVKDQGQCGSCWAFSSIGSTESLYAIKKGNLTEFSEQELVDCSWNFGNEGCNGGLMEHAFDYMIEKGISLESEYPYIGRDAKCAKKSNSFQIKTYNDVAEDNSDDLLIALNIEPITVSVEADQDAWQMYKGGVVDDIQCGWNLDHGVLLVGSGYDSSYKLNFWRIKNSWGATWGENGYIRLLRQSGRGPGMCGIAMDATYPLYF